jgi:hypothetical protein
MRVRLVRAGETDSAEVNPLIGAGSSFALVPQGKPVTMINSELIESEAAFADVDDRRNRDFFCCSRVA